MRRARKAAARWLILGHRWLGIGTGLLFALWIGSGLVMLHVPFPHLSEAERIARLAPLAWERVALAPGAALAAAGLSSPPEGFALEMRGGAPVYRIGSGADRITVSAATGARLGPVPAGEALRIAGADGRATVAPVMRDQWSVVARYDPLRPFHRVALNDPAGTELYVSAVTGEIALDTTRFERGWNWVGAVVHWIYPTVLRADAALWRDVVLWVSGVAAVTAVSGLALGVWRLRLRPRYASGAVTPYRDASSRWSG